MSAALRTALDAYARECEKWGQGNRDTRLLKTRAEVDRLIGDRFTASDARGLLEALRELGVTLPPGLRDKLSSHGFVDSAPPDRSSDDA